VESGLAKKMDFFSDKKIIVTGGCGFLGRHLKSQLETLNPKQIIAPSKNDYDLCKLESIIDLYESSKADIVIHLAASVGGIGANRDNPGKFFYENALMGIQLMEYARRYNIKKFVTLGTICAYPKFCPLPFKEDDLWQGYPEETNAAYGLAKKMLLVQAQSYRAQYDFNAVYLLPVNLYGPGDNFDLNSSHVIPALIRKCLEAIESNSNEVAVWGSGEPTREFLYVEDAARAILLATQKYNKSEPG